MKYHYGTIFGDPYIYWVDENGKPVAKILRIELERVVREKGEKLI